MAVNPTSLPFLEAIAFFRAKLNLPTAKWDDLLGAAHDRAFVVAGAMKADLLADLREAIDQAISSGTTLDAFRADFAQIVAQRGWTGWTGQGTIAGEAWRTRVIYDTNLFTSYSAGRYQQMKAVTETRPYWRYRHSPASVEPRPEHLAWDGLILRHDDPWWSTHSPPGGFGCFVAGTEVATPTGWQAIEALRIGDKVIGGSGNIQTVESPQIRPFDGEIIWVATEQGEVAATPNHRFLTLRGWIRADNLDIGDVLVQIPQVSSINHSVGDIKHFHSAGTQLSVARPFGMIQSSRSEAFNAHIERRKKNIDPVGEKATVMNRIKSPIRQFIQKQILDSSRWSAGVNMSRRILLMAGAVGIRYFCTNLRTERRRTNLQFFSSASRSFVSFLGLPLAWMTAFRRLLQHSLPQNLRGFLSAGVIFYPLDHNALMVVSGSNSKPLHQPHDGSVVAVPPLTKAWDSPSLVFIQDPEGFVSGAPLDKFNSLDDFCSWARAHGVTSKVVEIRRQSYTGSVYNLSITEDSSYCLRIGVVHNCKCYVETLAERDMKKGDLQVTDKGAIPFPHSGIDKGWDYQPGASTAPLVDMIKAKAPNWEPQWVKAMLQQWQQELPADLYSSIKELF